MFIKLTHDYTKGPVLINLSHVATIKPMKDGVGTKVTISIGEKVSELIVSESFEDISEMLPVYFTPPTKSE